MVLPSLCVPRPWPLVFLTLWLLPDHSKLYTGLLTAVGLFFAALAGSYGLKAYRDERKSQDR